MTYKIDRSEEAHQKTALVDGFNVPVGCRPTVPQVKVNTVYHKLVNLSSFKSLRGPDGSRTRTFYLRGKQSAINLPAQFTEAALFSQKLNTKVNAGVI